VRKQADNSTVTLAGVADAYGTRQAAENAAWRAKGDSDVTDNIAIQPV
jgi:osmotically-inducible protein OsmY